MINILETGIAFLPIITFLVVMYMMDSFQLVKTKDVAVAILVGFFVAILAVFVNNGLMNLLDLESVDVSRFVAPVTEEILKILFIIYVIRVNKVGFMVDAAILGFAVGAGFAIIENFYYMNYLTDAGILTWFVRGFGTAIMHGGATAIAAVICKDLADRKNWPFPLVYLPGLMAAIVIHALFNMFILPPITMALIVILTLPAIFVAIFKKSESNTREWLGTGLDSDMEMLRILLAGNITDTRIGNYIKSIENNFPPTVVGDLICYLRIYLELSVEAKGILIMKNSGIELPLSPLVEAQFSELNYLDSQIGKTGKLAIQPLLKLNNTDLWQLSMMRENAKVS